jgi:hypothetical protein
VFRVFRGAEKSRGTGNVVLETWYWKRGVSRFLPVSLVQCDEPNRLEYLDCSTYNGLAIWSEEAHVGL